MLSVSMGKQKKKKKQLSFLFEIVFCPHLILIQPGTDIFLW